MNIKAITCEDFVNVLGSKAPAPGGGGAAALAGAVGTALGTMVGALTIGKSKYAEYEDRIKELIKESEKLQERLLDLIGEDAEGFEPLAKAYGMPSETEEQKATKRTVMEGALAVACEAPMEIMKCCCKAIDLHQQFGQMGSRLAVSDVGTGVTLCRSALVGASLNVFVNTKAMADREQADGLNNEVNAMLDKYSKKADDIFEEVKSQLV